MSKLIHIRAPNSSTGEERKAEEARVGNMFPHAYVVCTLEGWSFSVHDIETNPNMSEVDVKRIVSDLLANAFDQICT
jgi:hypothetical protein